MERKYLDPQSQSAASYHPSAAGYDCWSFGDLEKTIEKEDWSWVDVSPIQESSKKSRGKGEPKPPHLPKLSLFRKYKALAYLGGALLCGGLGYQIAQQGYLAKIKNKAVESYHYPKEKQP